jgi:uncharacterized protein involved in propanediol utilization
MPIPQEVLKKQHQDKVVEVTDTTSRFSFKFECSCGVQGLFYDKESAQKYREYHLRNKGLSAESIT